MKSDGAALPPLRKEFVYQRKRFLEMEVAYAKRYEQILTLL